MDENVNANGDDLSDKKMALELSKQTDDGMFVRCLREKRATVYDDPNVDDVIEGKRSFSVEEKLHDDKFKEPKQCLLEMEGGDFTLKYIQENGFNTPMLFKSKDGLDIKLPNPDMFSVNDVKSYVGARRIIDVFDCDTHSPEKMTVHQFVRYYMSEEKEKLLNVTSLEFSQTGLERLIDCPITIREDLDWVPLVWPEHLINEQKDSTNAFENMKYPKVRKYCLMSVGGCYTDFHIDFGGSSVWYHVLKGSKVFWLIPPTDKNLEIFEKWALSGRQSDVFFGDIVDDCFRIHLVAGDTFMIPTGWIHSVYTPEDSLVFGGNYLHSYNIPLQLRIHDIEEATHVPKHLRFPFFAEIHWYLVKVYVEILERDMDERRKLEFEGDSNVDNEEDDKDGGVFKLLNDEMNIDLKTTNGDSPTSKTTTTTTAAKWQFVHLTVFEMEGLKMLCERLRSWSHAKINYPKDFNEDSMELLDRLEELLQYHEDDDQILACNGNNIFKQYALDKTMTDNGLSSDHIKKEFVTKSSPQSTKDSNNVSTATTPVKTKHKVTSQKSPEVIASSSEDQVAASLAEKKKRARRVRNQTVPINRNGDDSSNIDQKVEKRRSVVAGEKNGEEKTDKRVRKTPKKYDNREKEKTIIRRVRCHACEGCSRTNCNECRFCLDMKKNGGEGKLRQSCAMRFCGDPQLPAYVVCNVCESRDEGGLLMECHVCSEVVHPACMEERKQNARDTATNKKKNFLTKCKISKKVNNSWECPKCCQADDDATEFSVNAVEKMVDKYKQENRTTATPKPSLGKSQFSLKRLGKQTLLSKIQNGGKSKKNNFDLGSEGSDDEPLIKKKYRKVADSDDEPLSKKKQKSKENGTPRPVLNIVQPVAIIRPAPITNAYQHCQINAAVTPSEVDATTAITTAIAHDAEIEQVVYHCLPRDMWVRVFTYLDKMHLNRCMAVCKAWNQWSLDNRLWTQLVVSNKILLPTVLKGIVRRQPANLALPSSRATAKQMEWLLNRLPRLQGLDLSLNTAAAVSSLLHVYPTPPLRALNLSWCDAVYDRFLSQVFGPVRSVTGVKKVTTESAAPMDNDDIGCSRLRSVETLTLNGCEVAYETMNLIFTMLPCLRHLDLSYCIKVKDKDFDIVMEGKNVNKLTLRKIVCVGCPLVTEVTEAWMRSLPNAPELVRAL